ncbi:MAG: tetratricopeptide repeat protein [Gammaproteobacteria bacterium]
MGMDNREPLTLRTRAESGDTEAMVNLAAALRARGDHEEANKWLVRAGAAGDQRAVATLAVSVSEEADPDSTRVFDWVRRASEQGNRDCMLLLAEMYRDGTNGAEPDYRQMLRWLLHAVAVGAPEAARLVSEAYAKGLGVPESSAKSILWLTRAAEAGDTVAMARIAERHLAGLGVPRNASAYFQWTYKGAKAGDPAMMLNVAKACRAGVGTPVDVTASLQWVQKAAEQQYPAALYALALCYRDGSGVKPDRGEYRRILARAAEAGHPQAMNDLAIRYLYGDGVPVDVQRHVQLLRRAADAGEPSAMFNLGHAYRDGAGVAKDEQQYLAWLEKSAELRHSDSLVELAAWHYRQALQHQWAKEVDRLAEDMRFERLAVTAAEAGDARAMYLLAMAHRGAIAALSDTALSRRWTERAAEAGLPIAMLDLATLYREGHGSEKDIEKYFFWIRHAAEAGDLNAARQLGLAYHDGEGTTPDLEACHRWLDQAASRGDQAAFVLLGLLELERVGEILPGVLHAALEPFMDLQAEVAKIKRDHLVREAPTGVAYFCAPQVLGGLLAGDAAGETNRLRLYNAAYLEDMQDGRSLFGFESAPASVLRSFFPEQRSRHWPITTPWDGREYSVYLASFNLGPEYPDQWRAHDAQGAGVCIVTPLRAFAQDREHLPLKLEQSDVDSDVGSAPTQLVRVQHYVRPVLYRVEYDPAAAAAAVEAMRPHLEAIQAFKGSLKRGGDTVDALVRVLLGEILYLFKPEAYKCEREARVIVSCDIASDYVRCDVAQQPARMYVETEPFLFTATDSLILIGPAVRERSALYLSLRYGLAKSRWAASTRMRYSSVEYR